MTHHAMPRHSLIPRFVHVATAPLPPRLFWYSDLDIFRRNISGEERPKTERNRQESRRVSHRANLFLVFFFFGIMERGERNLEGEGRGVVRWEMFLPRPFVRVLLVEGDNSTREIVSVLLRKCGYRGMFCSLDLFFFFFFLFLFFLPSIFWNFSQRR